LKIIRDVKKARATLLKRTPPETQEAPPWLKQRIVAVFGRPMACRRW